MNRYTIPLGLFVVLAIFLAVGLTLNPREVPSPLIDKPAPAFDVAQLHAADKTISPKDMLGKVWIFNVWASWCVACREEHSVLMGLAKLNVVPIVGLNHKDKRDDGIAWLKRFGDPYVVSAFDKAGGIGIDYGVYGVPETFVVDKTGVIRYKRIGPITPEIVRDKILPLVQTLNRSGA